MTSSSVRDQLQALPPSLAEPLDRFERVRDLVRRRRRRQVAGGVAAVVLAMATVPLAVHLASSSGPGRSIEPVTPSTPADETPPGADRVTPLSEPRTQDLVGSQSVDLGDRPDGATAVSITMTCLTAGRVVWPDGSSSSCSSGSGDPTSQGVVQLAPGQHVFEFHAHDDVGWRLSTTYVRVEPTPWGINAKGDTYGVANDRGEPDLLATLATNGRRGYVYVDELDRASGGDVKTPEEALEWQQEHGGEDATIPVYESDGETVIGEFTIASTS